MYDLHIGNKNYSSWSLRPWVLMTELKIAFTEHLHPFSDETAAGAYRTFSPSGRVPCLVDEGFAVWDSLAIAEYLAERHPNVWPADPKARAWARCASAEMHSGFATLRNDCSMNCGIRVALHTVSDALKKDVARIDELWSDGLKRHGGPFLGGASFTAVDAYFAPVCFRVQTYGLTLSEGPAAYVKRVIGLGAMKRWYDAALKEPWRDREHEDLVKSVGSYQQDFRLPAPA